MHIHTLLVERYCEKNGTPITISFSIDQIEPAILITRGHYEQNGGRREYLDFQDIKDILEINNVHVKNRKELDSFSEELSSGKGDNFNRLQNVESNTYDTLAKYIIQMLNGAPIPVILYDDIVPLPKHKEFFRTV